MDGIYFLFVHDYPKFDECFLLSPRLTLVERKQLQELLRLAGEKAGLPSDKEWQESHFIHLSSLIEAETKTIISKNTLKRLYGKIKTPEYYSPQIETRNAIARFCGFENWMKYVRESSPSKAESAEHEISEKSRTKKLPLGWALWLAAGVLLIFIVFTAKRYWEQSRKESLFEQVTFSVETSNDTIPFTAIIRFDAPQELQDSLSISVGGRKYDLNMATKELYISQQTPVSTFIYIRYGKKLLKTKPYIAYSKSWEGYYGKQSENFYVPRSKYIKNGLAGLTKEFFIENGIDSSYFNFNLGLVKDLKVHGDNYSLKTRIKILPNMALCHGLLFKVIGEFGHHELRLYKKDCTNQSFASVSDKFFDGKHYDLSGLGLVPGEWHFLEMQVKDKTLTVIVDNKEVFNTAYNQTMGALKSFILKFSGFGFCDYIYLYDKEGNLVEKEDFDNIK